MKELICIVCPKGCHLQVDEQNDYQVFGNSCPRGAEYGKNELLDIVDENGKPTGETVERKTAHSEGIRHRTAHVWIVRKSDEGAEVNTLQ